MSIIRLLKNKRKGFTLIEMVIVIALMAILALIGVPNLTAYIQKSETAQIRSNLKNLHTAAELVIQTNPKITPNDIWSIYNIETRIGYVGSAQELIDEIVKYSNIDTTKTPVIFGEGYTGYVEETYSVNPTILMDGRIAVSFSVNNLTYHYDGIEYYEVKKSVHPGPF